MPEPVDEGGGDEGLAEDERSSTRRPLLIIALVLILGVGGVAGWLWYERQPDDTGIRVFMAEPGPYKREADEENLASSTAEEAPRILVLEPPGSAESVDRANVLMPPPEEPVDPRIVLDGDGDAPVDVEAEEFADEIIDDDTTPIITAEQVDAFVEQSRTATATVAQKLPPRPGIKPPAPGRLARQAAPEDSGEAAAEEDLLSFSDVAAALELAESTGETADNTDSAALDGVDGLVDEIEAEVASDVSDEGLEVRVQISSSSSRERALAYWNTLSADHADILAGLQPVIVEVLVTDQYFYRLQIGDLGSEEQAQTLCDTLQERQLDCFLLEP